MNVPEVGDLGHAAKLCRAHLLDRRVDRHHGVVDPDVDRAELRLDARGGCFDGVGVGDVQRKHQRASAERLDLEGRLLEALAAARDEPDGRAVARKPSDDRPA